MRFPTWTVLLVLFTTCSPPQIPAAVPPEVPTYNEEAFIALSDSIMWQALYEVTGLIPIPDTIVSNGDTVVTLIQVLEHQPFNAPFILTRIEGTNYAEQISLNRFVIEHDLGCSYPLVDNKGRQPFDPSCYLVLDKYVKKIPQKEWKEFLQLIRDTDLTELAYLPRRGSLLDGDHLTLKYLEADVFEYLDFEISREAPGENLRCE